MATQSKSAEVIEPVPSDGTAFRDVVERLVHPGGRLTPRAGPRPPRALLPSRASVIEMAEALRFALFPGFFGAGEVDARNLSFNVGTTLDHALRLLREQAGRALRLLRGDDRCWGAECDQRAEEIADAFLARLPEVQRLLESDVLAAFEGDPAASAPEEVVYCYPGLFALTSYRIAHELHALGVPLVPRMITEHAHSLTGIDIHPGATIGESFFIDHGTGVVIGETAVIGHRVRLYQGVTLGAKSFCEGADGKLVKGQPRHPIVEDDVVIYAGATILGRVTIGQGSVIGGNVWLTRSVPAQSVITQAKARREHFEHGDGI